MDLEARLIRIEERLDNISQMLVIMLDELAGVEEVDEPRKDLDGNLLPDINQGHLTL